MRKSAIFNDYLGSKTLYDSEFMNKAEIAEQTQKKKNFGSLFNTLLKSEDTSYVKQSHTNISRNSRRSSYFSGKEFLASFDKKKSLFEIEKYDESQLLEVKFFR